MFTQPCTRRQFLWRAVSLLSLACISFAASTAGVDYQAGRHKIWPKNLVRALQSKLTELGYQPGDADGLYGSKTAQAISAYQQAEQIEVDGKISEELLARLLEATEIE